MTAAELFVEGFAARLLAHARKLIPVTEEIGRSNLEVLALHEGPHSLGLTKWAGWLYLAPSEVKLSIAPNPKAHPISVYYYPGVSSAGAQMLHSSMHYWIEKWRPLDPTDPVGSALAFERELAEAVAQAEEQARALVRRFAKNIAEDPDRAWFWR